MPKGVTNVKDDEINVTYEDQQSINKFARVNARMVDMKEELEDQKKKLQNLEDAGDELLMAEDESELIPFQVGEVFVGCTQEEATKMLEQSKADVEAEIADIEKRCEEHEAILSDLKVKLYAKFGNNINLEAGPAES